MTISLNGSKSIVANDFPGNLDSHALAISSIDCRIYFSKRLWRAIGKMLIHVVLKL